MDSKKRKNELKALIASAIVSVGLTATATENAPSSDATPPSWKVAFSDARKAENMENEVLNKGADNECGENGCADQKKDDDTKKGDESGCGEGTCA